MQSPLRIVVIGSSTAAGIGAEPVENAWVDLYRAHLETLHPASEVINLGLGGLQTFHLTPTGHRPPRARPLPDPERNITRALSFQPHAVIMHAPSNDAMAGYGPEEQLRNFDLIDQAAGTQGIPVWFCTPQPRRFSAEQIQIQIRLRDALLARYGDRAINIWHILATPDGLPQARSDAGDGAHLNNLGHRLVFEQVRDKNIPLALSRRPLLASGSVLNIPAVTPGQVYVEVYDSRACLHHRAKGTLPLRIQRRLGGPGLYWVRIAGEKYNRLLPWVML
ncbi:MAG: SGNH/GDSL hydrolase family protein [Saprospirales bacterium]|jgi:lysophospholipase L1-like esterase|nr:SGNH/GDSL hydrolase family protein [Saprospirales bacterium]MBK8921192.1 SGNH/GDSL hydrolase family protein [Saprospirales bacterium]